MTKDYECLFILRPDLTEETIEKEVKTAREYFESDGGSITDESAWGKKRLAYSIRKQRYGFYMLFRCSIDGGSIKAIERKFLLNENVLKAMIIVVDSSIAGKPLPNGVDNSDQYRRSAAKEKESKPVTEPVSDVEPK